MFYTQTVMLRVMTTRPEDLVLHLHPDRSSTLYPLMAPLSLQAQSSTLLRFQVWVCIPVQCSMVLLLKGSALYMALHQVVFTYLWSQMEL